MKYAKSTMFYLIASLFAVLAVAFAPMAHAGDLKPAYKASNGVVFTIKADDIGFACDTGTVTVTQRNTDARVFQDASGAVCAKVVASPGFFDNYVQQPGTKNYYRATFIEAYCGSPQGVYGSVLSYLVNGGPLVIQDGCQTDAIIKARAN